MPIWPPTLSPELYYKAAKDKNFKHNNELIVELFESVLILLSLGLIHGVERFELFINIFHKSGEFILLLVVMLKIGSIIVINVQPRIFDPTGDALRVTTKYITIPINIAMTETIYFEEELSIRNFFEMCHRVVTDRPDFSLDDRVSIYKTWLRSRHPCLMAAKDREGRLIAATIILPLTYLAYVKWWLNWLDSLRIGPEHMEAPGSKGGYRYLLVDLAARNQAAIRALPQNEQQEYTAVA
jgi:hypothetical protein